MLNFFHALDWLLDTLWVRPAPVTGMNDPAAEPTGSSRVSGSSTVCVERGVQGAEVTE